MSSEDFAYYRDRIRAERQRAQEASSPDIAAIHDKLAHLYESLTDRMERSAAGQDLSPLPQAQTVR